MVNEQKQLKLIALSWAIVISIGALSAHALEESLSQDALESFITGNKYHLYGNISLVLLLLINKHWPLKHLKRILTIQWIGMFLFSGSIYLLATKSLHHIDFVSNLWPLTPLGGIFLIWVWIDVIINLKNK